MRRRPSTARAPCCPPLLTFPPRAARRPPPPPVPAAAGSASSELGPPPLFSTFCTTGAGAPGRRDCVFYRCRCRRALWSRNGNIFMYVFMKLRRETEERCRFSPRDGEGREGVGGTAGCRPAARPARPAVSVPLAGRWARIGRGRCGPPNGVRGGPRALHLLPRQRRAALATALPPSGSIDAAGPPPCPAPETAVPPPAVPTPFRGGVWAPSGEAGCPPCPP